MVLQDGRTMEFFENDETNQASQVDVGMRGRDASIEGKFKVSHYEKALFYFGRLNNKLVALIKFVGTPMVGFEGEILTLLRKMEARRGASILGKTKKRKYTNVSKATRELHKLESLVNLNGGAKRVNGASKNMKEIVSIGQ